MENQTQSVIKKGSNTQKTIISSVAIILFFALTIFLGGKKPERPVATQTNSFDGIEITPTVSDVHLVGSDTVKITIVEYTDTECPFCKSFHETMKTLMKQYNGKIAWEYRHYPIPQLHKKAFHESEALECAWEQGNNITFWKYVDEIYTRTQSNDSLDVSELPTIAKDIGLDVSLFNTCLASGKFADKIESDIMAGKAAGVQGTPTSFLKVNGEVVDMIQGAQPIEVIQEKIDALLK